MLNQDHNQSLTFKISTWSIVKTILILIGFFLLYSMIDVLAVLFISLIFAAALDPWIDSLQRFRIPRGLSVLAMYVIILSFISLIIFLIIPPLASQLSDMSKSFPAIFEKATTAFYSAQGLATETNLGQELQKNIVSLESALLKATSGVFSTVVSIFGGLISFFSVLVITFYVTVEEQSIKKFVLSLIPEKNQERVLKTINAVQKKVGLWLRGQLILMLVIGVMTYIGLKIIGIEYALLLALIAGMAEFVPFLGPVISAIPAIFIALTQSPLQAVGVLVLYLIIQQLENNLIVPKIMQRAVGLNPLVIIIVLLVGAKLAGVMGAILAIPVTTALHVVFKDKLNSAEEKLMNGETS